MGKMRIMNIVIENKSDGPKMSSLNVLEFCDGFTRKMRRNS